MSDNDKHVDEVTGVETTGHVWDGIRELNNPLPRWWLWIFYATIVFSVGYMIYYPSVPLVDGATEGVGGYSSRAELEQEMRAATEAKSAMLERIAASEVGAISDDGELLRFAIAGGGSAYKVYCSQCHGSGAQGAQAQGYPNLNDDAWLWGGTVDQIYATIAHGVRYEENPDTRYSEMPAFGRDGILSGEQIRNLAHYVRALSGLAHDMDKAAAAETDYLDNCAACHGDNGGGNVDLGAPDIADAVWLYGSETEQLESQIHNPNHGVMPAWEPRLGEATVKQLAVYIHSLGGGQ